MKQSCIEKIEQSAAKREQQQYYPQQFQQHYVPACRHVGICPTVGRFLKIFFHFTKVIKSKGAKNKEPRLGE